MEKKTPLYWAIEKEDTGLVHAIASKLEGQYNKDFKVKQRSAGGARVGNMVYKCKKFKKKIKPSEWAKEIGNIEAEKMLKAMKM